MKMLGNLIKFLDNNWAKMFSCIFTGQNGCQTSLEWALKSFCVENTPRDEMNFENYSRYWNFVFRKKKRGNFSVLLIMHWKKISLIKFTY